MTATFHSSFRKRSATLFLIIVALASLGAGNPKTGKDASVADLALEVAALQTFYVLDLTRPQLEDLGRRAADTASRNRNGPEPKVSDLFRKTLIELRDALSAPRDAKRIEKLSEDFGKLQDSEDVELDDDIDVTEEAADAAPEFLKTLKPRQVALYSGSYADAFSDPTERLVEGIGKVRGLTDGKWTAYRDEISEELADLLAGLDEEKGTRIRGQVTQFLIVIRSLKEDEFKTRQSELAKKARKIVGDVGPTDVIRNVLERALAELLSNPRLPAAIDARLRNKP